MIPAIVITSYSIHYTKLYERSLGGQLRSVGHGTTGATQADTDAARIVVTEVLVHGERVLAHDLAVDNRTTATDRVRITSYNVCYTKLLRP